MEAEEFSTEFDVLINAFDISQGITFNEYEKSLFLTKAQEMFVDFCYKGAFANRAPFEGDEEARRSLSELVSEHTMTPISSDNDTPVGSYFFKLPGNLRYIVYERAKLSSDNKCVDGKWFEVFPVKHDDLHRTLRNPFKYHDKKVLRLDIRNSFAEIVSKNPVTEYNIRYIRNPYPIILDTLYETTIQGMNGVMGCMLPENTHRPILDLAVRLALESKQIRTAVKPNV